MAKITILDKILKHRAYEIANNRNYDEYQRTLASMVYKFLDKKARSRISVNSYEREWLDNNDILMYLTHNEGKLVIAERFIKTLRSIKNWQLLIANLIFIIWIN